MIPIRSCSMWRSPWISTTLQGYCYCKPQEHFSTENSKTNQKQLKINKVEDQLKILNTLETRQLARLHAIHVKQRDLKKKIELLTNEINKSYQKTYDAKSRDCGYYY